MSGIALRVLYFLKIKMYKEGSHEEGKGRRKEVSVRRMEKCRCADRGSGNQGWEENGMVRKRWEEETAEEREGRQKLGQKVGATRVISLQVSQGSALAPF